MASIDMTVRELEAYAPEPYAPDDLEEFWTRTLAAALAQPLEVAVEPYALELAGVRSARVTFDGFEGGRLTAWYVRPDGPGPFPAVASYHGYSGRAARPLELYTLAAQGIAVLSLDCRAQNGESTDGVVRPSGHVAGWMTQGVGSPERYYYRHVYADAVRALEVLCAFPEVDASRVATTGVSQGGGLSLAAAALSSRPRFVWADIPFLCDIRRGAQISERLPYTEISDYLRSRPSLEDELWHTISYVDLLNLADRVTCETVVTVALWDDICPPSTIYSTFRRIAAPRKSLRVLPYHYHDLSYEIAEERLVALCAALGARPSG
ncbi:MAG TPA: acetylxylan esterase [Acidimicrobiales bacterium]|nr:acetylxylan esterase [Acidimicrobiales bacterium]